MITFHCLFFFRETKVRVYRAKRNEWTEIKRNGLSDFTFSNESDLWTWWEHATGITRKDDVDFIFISDTPRIFHYPFRDHDSTCTIWGEKKLESFFSRYCDEPAVNLQWIKNNETNSILIKNAPTPKLPEAGTPVTFYVFPALNMPLRKTDDQARIGSILDEVFHKEVKDLEKIKEGNRKRIKRK
jgi:hypothetical protein